MLLRVFLFTVFRFLCTCSSMKHASLCTHHHITIFIFLHIHTILNQDLFSVKSCLMSFVKPSHTFKLKSILDSSVTICLDKVVYFTFEQTPKNWAIHFTLLGKELPQQNMLIKKRILMLKFTSDSWGGNMSLGKSLQIHAESWKIILNPGTQLSSAGCFLIYTLACLESHPWKFILFFLAEENPSTTNKKIKKSKTEEAKKVRLQ